MILRTDTLYTQSSHPVISQVDSDPQLNTQKISRVSGQSLGLMLGIRSEAGDDAFRINGLGTLFYSSWVAFHVHRSYSTI